MKLLPLLLAGFCLCLWGQSRGTKSATKPAVSGPAAPAGKWPIESLKVEGNHAYTVAQILAAAGLKAGQTAGGEDFEAARDRLIATGAFETVGYKFAPAAGGKGYAASFQVTESPTLYPIRFEELGAADTDLVAVLAAHDPLFSMSQTPAVQPVLDRYARWIEEYLASKGKPEKVMGQVLSPRPNQFVILFRPARNRPAVAEVSFEGNQVLPQTVLREAIGPSAVGAAYTEEDFRQILDASIRPLYEARGRVRVAFTQVRAEPLADPNGVHVFVTVDEGQVYSLGKIEVEKPSPIDPRQLLREGDFKTGDIANFDQIAAGIENIRKAVRRAGYLDAKVTSDRVIDDAKKTVDIGIHVDAGPQYTMGKLTLAGLDLEGEAALNRIWALKEGKPFNPEYPDAFLNRVRDEGMFDHLGKTKADVRLDQKRHVADVTLVFTGDDPNQRKVTRRGRGW
jgi:outer membrane protein assembly factor BamA